MGIISRAVFLSSLMGLIVFSTASPATIYYVNPGDTIQDAIDAVTDGDTIIVSPGTYSEKIFFNGKNIVLTGTAPENTSTVANTIIDGSDSGSVVTFSGTESVACLIEGFKIRNGTGTLNDNGSLCGGGIYGNGTYATIQNNIITQNGGTPVSDTVSADGGGIYDCDGIIQNNTITYNHAFQGGGLHSCDGIIRNNFIRSNSANSWQGGGISKSYGRIVNNLISNNSAAYGGGLYDCDGVIINNTIINNSVSWPYGGAMAACGGTIKNCIVWGNTAPQISGCSTLSFTCIEGWSDAAESTTLYYNPYAEVDWNQTRHKANFHSHSSHSDGSESIPVIVTDYYHNHGYSILAITDHDYSGTTTVYTNSVTSDWSSEDWGSGDPRVDPDVADSVCTIPGVEASKGHHLVGLFSDYTGYHTADYSTTRQSISNCNDSGGLIVFAHPGFNNARGIYNRPATWFTELALDYPDCVYGMELKNSIALRTGQCKPTMSDYYDETATLLFPQKKLWLLCSNDDHDTIDRGPSASIFMSDNPTESTVRADFIAGRFYATYNETPDSPVPIITTIEVSEDSGTITVTSDATVVHWIGDHGDFLTSGNVLHYKDLNIVYARAVLEKGTDATTGYAYTQPFLFSSTGAAGGKGNTAEDPLLVNEYQLNYSVVPLNRSPCIDAGDNSGVTEPTDIEGNQRIQGLFVDMGCYESPGDLDDDGMADSWEISNFGDLLAVADDDPETDGFTNIYEFTFLSDPNEFNVKTLIRLDEPDTSIVLWNSATTHQYKLWDSDDMTSWAASEGWLTGTGSWIYRSRSIAGLDMIFYKVECRPVP